MINAFEQVLQNLQKIIEVFVVVYFMIIAYIYEINKKYLAVVNNALFNKDISYSKNIKYQIYTIKLSNHQLIIIISKINK